MCKNRREAVHVVRAKIAADRYVGINETANRFVCATVAANRYLRAKITADMYVFTEITADRKVCAEICANWHVENNFELERILKNGFLQLCCYKKRCRPLSNSPPH